MFKWKRGYNKKNIDISKVLKVNNQGKTRDNGFKLEKFRFRIECKKDLVLK